MEEVFDFGTGTPYTDDDLEALYTGRTPQMRANASCAACAWFDADSDELCRGPITCAKWMDCGKCCPLTGRLNLIEFEGCTHFQIDPLMCS